MVDLRNLDAEHEAKLATVIDRAAGGPSKRIWIASLTIVCLLLSAGIGGFVFLAVELRDCTSPNGRCYQKQAEVVRAEADARTRAELTQTEENRQSIDRLVAILTILQDATGPAALAKQAQTIQGIVDQINRDTQASLAQVERDLAALLKVAAPLRLTTIPPPRVSPATTTPVSLAPVPTTIAAPTTTTTVCVVRVNGACLVR